LKTVVLIGCGKEKLPGSHRAEDLYQGDLFKKSLEYARQIYPNADIYVLSAKYGLLPLNKVIACYDETLKGAPAADKRKWTEEVINDLRKAGYDLQKDYFVILAGRDYRDYLLPELVHYEIPMKGLLFGEQKSWLKNKLIKIKANETSSVLCKGDRPSCKSEHLESGERKAGSLSLVDERINV